MYNTFNPNAQICCKKRAWFQENALWFESFPWWRLNLCHTCPPVMEVNKRHIGFAGGLWCVFKVAILAKHPCSTENFHTWNTKTKQQFYIQSPNCIHDIWCIYIYIYWTYQSCPWKYTPFMWVNPPIPFFFTIHPHLHLRVEILVPLPWLRHERSDEDFLHLAMGAIDKVLPPWMTLRTTMLLLLQKCGFGVFFRNVTQE